MVRKSFFIVAIWTFLSSSPISSSTQSTSSPRSPGGRKTKSPGLFGFPSDDSMDLPPTPRSSPRFKRSRSVRISEDVFFHWPDESESELEEDKSEPMRPLERSYEITNNCEIIRPIATRSIELSPQSIVATPDTPEPQIQLQISRPILKLRVFHRSPLQLFKSGTINDLKAYYDRGVQLALPEPAVNDILKHLLESGQFGKLKVIYERDRLKLVEFILKNEEIASETIFALASAVFSKRTEQFLMDLQESTREYSTIEVRVAFYLFAVFFDTQEVYNITSSLLDARESNHRLIKEIIDQYNRKPESVPLLIFAIQKGLEFETIVEFDPSEIDRLDSENCSIIYHAASEGNLDVLELFKKQLKNRELAGVTPLVGAAKNNRDDSLKFFLNDADWLLSEKDYEDAAFAAAVCGNYSFFKLLLIAGKIDLYSYRGDSTFLSVALRNDSLGFAKSLVECLNYNVNFVGEDAINPEGHALAYVLGKYSFVEMFLKRGASRNIKIYIEDEERLVTFEEYLKLKNDPRLVKLLEKYPSI